MGQTKPPLAVVGAAILKDGKCLVAQRKEEGTFPRKWEFPGGKVETNESQTNALIREIREELGVEVEVLDHAGRGYSESAHHEIVLDVFFARLVEGTPVTHEHLALAWADADELMLFDYAPADIPVLDAVRARLRTGS